MQVAMETALIMQTITRTPGIMSVQALGVLFPQMAEVSIVMDTAVIQMVTVDMGDTKRDIVDMDKVCITTSYYHTHIQFPFQVVIQQEVDLLS